MTCCGHPNTCETPCFHGGSIKIDAAGGLITGFGYATGRFLETAIIGCKTPQKVYKPILDGQCEAAMARLKAHIDSRCAEHREAIRANHVWDVRNMHARHDGYAVALSLPWFTLYDNGELLAFRISIR